MGRSSIQPVKQVDEVSCGPASLKTVLRILGRRKSLQELTQLCRTTSHGTSTNKMIQAIRKLNLSALYLERATLRHILSALKYSPKHPRAILISYLYETDPSTRSPDIESGHWAVVGGYRASDSRIILFDSASGKKRSYAWNDFKTRWMDYELKRYRIRQMVSRKPQFRLIRRKQKQHMIVISRAPEHLPRFSLALRTG